MSRIVASAIIGALLGVIVGMLFQSFGLGVVMAIFGALYAGFEANKANKEFK